MNLPMPVICNCGFATMDAKEAVQHAYQHELRDLMPGLPPELDPLKRIYCPKCGENCPCFLGNNTFQCTNCHTYFSLIDGKEQEKECDDYNPSFHTTSYSGGGAGVSKPCSAATESIVGYVEGF